MTRRPSPPSLLYRMNAKEEALQLLALPPRLGARGETQEGNADLP